MEELLEKHLVDKVLEKSAGLQFYSLLLFEQISNKY